MVKAKPHGLPGGITTARSSLLLVHPLVRFIRRNGMDMAWHGEESMEDVNFWRQATLKDGRLVAVKVQHRHAARQIPIVT